jgi:diguanylate cyclase (GGDEF)-like protein
MELIDNIKNNIYNVSEEISKMEKESQVYALVLDAAISLIPNASKGSILILQDDDTFHYKAVNGYSEKLYNITLKKEESFLYNINNFSETAIIDNPINFDKNVVTKEKMSFLIGTEALDIVCTLSAPIYINGTFVGMINVDSTERGSRFTKDDIKFMNHIKREMELALNNFGIQKKLRYMAHFDELTGLFNRRFFKIILNEELEKVEKYKHKCCLAVIDLDDFKMVNDNYGHNMGDKVLQIFADALRHNIKKTDVYARMSGDEFIILFRNSNMEAAKSKLEYIRNILCNEQVENITINFSYGICTIDPESGLEPDYIFGCADRAMYCDKRNKNIRCI